MPKSSKNKDNEVKPETEESGSDDSSDEEYEVERGSARYRIVLMLMAASLTGRKDREEACDQDRGHRVFR